jgi:hypothetical protein
MLGVLLLLALQRVAATGTDAWRPDVTQHHWVSNASLVSVHDEEGLGRVYTFHVPVPAGDGQATLALPLSSVNRTSGALQRGLRTPSRPTGRTVAVVTLMRHGAEAPMGSCACGTRC